MSDKTSTEEQEIDAGLMDNLLIKDESGHFSHLNFNQNIDTGTTLVQAVSPVAMAAILPKNDHFLMLPQGNQNPNDKSVLMFHPDDDKEAEELAKNLPKDESKKYSLVKIVDKLIEKHSLHLTDENKKKFSSIIFDFFRHRKNAIIVREAMSENIFADGKVLSEETVNSLVSVIKAIKHNIEAEGGLVVEVENKPKAEPLIKDTASPDLASDLSSAVADLSKQFVAGPVEELEQDLNNAVDDKLNEEVEVQGEIQNILSDFKPKKDHLIKKEEAPEIVLDEPKSLASQTPEVKANIVPSVSAPEPQVTERPAQPVAVENMEIEPANLPKVFRPKQDLSKKQVTDVKQKIEEAPAMSMEDMVAPPKKPINLTGPIEELQNFSLDNFRHLGNSPSEQGAKLLAKINLLEKDSVTKKAQGIEAWRNSPIYRQYLSLGSESLGQGKDVATVITDYQNQGQAILTIEEFSAISDLNKNLRF